MEKSKIEKAIKRELIRAMLEYTQGIDMEKLGAPKAEDAIHFDDVEEILNIPYMNHDETPLGMDIFKPIVPKGTELPVIVTIHGGGLTMGDRKISRPFCRILAHKGYLVFSIEYRLAPRANVCMQLDDICAGLDIVGEKLVEYDVNFERIFMAAESGGAYLATYVTAMKGSKKLQEAIGYEPTRVSFKAIGLLSGMLYTNRKDLYGLIFSDQIYGEKRTDENFLQYMDPEHPEIINNLPPCYLITSKADFLNSHSFLIYEALKKSGKACKLLYYGSDELMHSFTTLQTEHSQSLDSIDRMLAWFEEQAEKEVSRVKDADVLVEKKMKMKDDLKTGKIDGQKIWQYQKARAMADPERLNMPAVFDCSKTWTYEQMYDAWDSYARVFTALGITQSNNSRVALVGSISAEPLFTYYACNMTGATVSMFSYPDLLPGGRWKTMIEKEHITDMIVSDIMVTPHMWEELKKAKLEFGLKNIILVHSLMGGPCTGYAEMAFNEFNYHALKRIPDVVFLDDLVEKYKDTEIEYGQYSDDGIAVICHTSGTSNGTRKPLPYTDRTVNAICSDAPHGVRSSELNIIKDSIRQDFSDVTDQELDDAFEDENSPFAFGRMVIVPPFDFSASSNINGLINVSLASGNSVVTTFFGFLHPKFVKAFKYYKADFVFGSGFMIDQWMQLPELDDDAFASIRTLGLGGSYISPEKLANYKQFFKDHGFTGWFFQGYGMSEIAGGLFITPSDSDEDTIGIPDNIDNYRIFDETDGKYHRLDEGVREGVFYGRADAMCENMLDGEILFDFVEIDGLNFICMNDVVHLDEKGVLSYVGRSNQFFVNNQGVKFESGLVEKMLSQHPNIKLCGIVPVLDKRIHDTVPILYIVPEHKDRPAEEEVKEALVDVFVKSDKLKGSVLPAQFIVVDSIPFSATGKIDIYHITRSRLKGSAFNIIPVREDGVIVDIGYEKSEQLTSYEAGTLPEGMGKDSAFGVFEIFSGKPQKLPSFKQLEKMVTREYQDKKEHLEKQYKKIKPYLPTLNVEMPEVKLSGMMGLPKMPPMLTAVVNIVTTLMYDSSVSTKDFEE